MTKPIKTQDELEDLIQQALLQHEDCQQALIKGAVYWHDYDRNGCNWGISTAQGHNWQACVERIKSVITDLQSHYNIADPQYHPDMVD